jgi:predicted MFS family arabinose efflux permease
VSGASDGLRSGLSEIKRDLAISARAFGSSFRNPDLARAQVAFVAFSVTEWASYIALVVYAFAHGGTAAIGVVSLVILIPAALIAPAGSLLGDRHRRERVYRYAEATMALFCALTAAAMLIEAAPWIVYALACVAVWVLSLVRPIHGALLPWIARDPTELTTAYTSTGLIESACVLLGPLLAAALFAVGQAFDVSGPGLVFVAMAALLALGALLLSGIRTESAPAPDEARPAIAGQLAAGFRYVWADRRPRVIVTLLGLSSFVEGMLDTLIVVLAIELLGMGQSGVGLLNAALGVGGIIGAAAAVVAGTRERLFPAFRLGSVLYGAPLAAIGAVPALGPLMLGVAGIGGAQLDVTGRTMLQRVVPDEKLTRSLGVLESAYMGAEGLGAAGAAVLISWIGPEWTFVICGTLLPLAALALRSGLRAVDVGARIPADDLELLRGTALFEPLPPTALERLARNSVPMRVTAGAIVIREGDVGDRVYVIAEGQTEVTAAGRHVARLGPGGYVGEIALLRDVRRTATVTALTEVRFLCLERDVFLRTMTGHEPARAAAHTAAESRLGELDAGRDPDAGTPRSG